MKQTSLFKNLAMPLALAAIALFFSYKLDLVHTDTGWAWQPVFLGSRNLTQLLIEFSTIATLALGMFMVILTGNIDLSVGSGVGLIGGISAVLIFHHAWSAPLAMLAGLAAALLLWGLTGTLIVKERIPSFIMTLGGLLIFKGLFWLVINSSTVSITRGEDNLFSIIITNYLPKAAGLGLAAGIALVFGFLQWRGRTARLNLKLPVPPATKAIGQWAAMAAGAVGLVIVCNRFRGVPFSLLILGATALTVYFLTRHTPFGRYLYAIGGNEEAAVLSGIAVDRIIIGAYVLMGVAVALTSFMTTAYTGASTPTVGDLMELDAIAACVIGGTALKGGRGTVWGVLFGALIMTSLLNGMQLLNVDAPIKYIARGTVLTLAVWMDVRLGQR